MNTNVWYLPYFEGVYHTRMMETFAYFEGVYHTRRIETFVNANARMVNMVHSMDHVCMCTNIFSTLI